MTEEQFKQLMEKLDRIFKVLCDIEEEQRNG